MARRKRYAKWPRRLQWDYTKADDNLEFYDVVFGPFVLTVANEEQSGIWEATVEDGLGGDEVKHVGKNKFSERRYGRRKAIDAAKHYCILLLYKHLTVGAGAAMWLFTDSRRKR